MCGKLALVDILLIGNKVSSEKTTARVSYEHKRTATYYHRDKLQMKL